MLDEQIADIEAWAGVPLADDYRAILVSLGGQFFGDRVRLYSADEVIERNECYQAQLYCPGFLIIGDDSGGRAVVIDPTSVSSAVFIVDHGSMSPDDFDLVSGSLLDWVNQGCRL